MAKPLFANNATASVTAITGTAAPASGTSQTFTVGSIVGMPAAVTGVSQFSFADPAQPSELMYATNTSGGTWTVTRGAEGTTPVVHASPFTIYKITSAGDLASMQQALTQTAVQASNYTAAQGSLLVPADTTSGAVTVTLPAAPASGTLFGVKHVTQGYTAGVPNAVTVARGGSDVFNKSGGGTSLTLPLLNQGLLLQYNSGVWLVVSDDLPLAGLNGLYANVFSPLAYGAAGDGTTNDNTPVHAAFTAAAAANGIVDLGHRTFLTSTPIPAFAGMRITGSTNTYGGTLVNNSSDLFSVTGTIEFVHIEHCTLTASAGHVFNCASTAFTAFWKITNAFLNQTSATHSIWYMPNGTYLNMIVGDGCFLAAAGNASVVPWLIVGLANLNCWRNHRVTFNYAGTPPTVPFYQIESDSASTWSSDNTFRDIDTEYCIAGIITGLTVSFTSIENVAGYDVTTYTASLFSFGPGTGALRSEGITVRNSGRRGGTLGGGAYDFYAAAGTQAILLENVGPESGSLPSYSMPTAYATVIGGEGGYGYVQSGLVSAIGTGTQARMVGGGASTGFPAAGTWGALDISADSGGTLWVCTAAGSPGTWTRVSSAAAAQCGSAMLNQGYLGSTFNTQQAYVTAPSASVWAAGYLYLARIDCVPNATANGYVSFPWLTHASMVNCYIGLYNSSGTRLGLTGDLSATTTGWHRVACTGFTATPADGIIYALYVNGTSGVAGGPYYIGNIASNGISIGAGLLPSASAAPFYTSSLSGSATSLPSPATLGSFTTTYSWTLSVAID